ncbi:hypothetical protein E1A91_A11G220500v1 [Gossypium mustelinum]|uniref:Uncharacterized protein n=2 Tax=Gossypium TaxID=3633 RepID=A0A5D2XA61_GOSMU|nr:hypothetical protein ES332_A11G229500v1 [Gossypium tomentosum]TYJ10630.1 hypothetical protein E1A91_A11G220500v1 [Gossypium mustelinum]
MHKQRPDSTDEGSAQGNLERLYGGEGKWLVGTQPPSTVLAYSRSFWCSRLLIFFESNWVSRLGY